MSETWPWVLLGRVARALPIPSDGDAGARTETADFTFPVALPPKVTVLTVAPLAHPDPNLPDKYPYVLAAGPDCILLNFAAGPFYGLNSAFPPGETYLVVARKFRTAQGAVRDATAFHGERVPSRSAGSMPVTYNIHSVGLLSYYNGDYIVAELQVDRGCERAKLFSFWAGDNWWIEEDLVNPLAEEDRLWVPSGVVVQKRRLWWFDLSWGLLSCDPFVHVGAVPVLQLHKLPEDRALRSSRPAVHKRRCVTVSRGDLRYVEIIPECSGGDTVSMWTRTETPAGWAWDKKYAMSFEEIWNDHSYKQTRLPRKVPVLTAVCPSNPDLVYFALEQRLFGVDVPLHRVVQVADEPYELVNLPWPEPASCRFVHAWNLSPWVATALDLVGSSSDEVEDQAEEPDDEELFKLGLQVAMGMDPVALESEVDKFYGEKARSHEIEGQAEEPEDKELLKLGFQDPVALKSEFDKFCEGFPSPEREVMMQQNRPFTFGCLPSAEAEADLRKVCHWVKKYEFVKRSKRRDKK
ncbi:hypothetical protein BS78_10G129500 [Paspalum vaginatum]|nr:hypothetical protein BS78_10G129500 [Paspalum vaginatum]